MAPLLQKTEYEALQARPSSDSDDIMEQQTSNRASYDGTSYERSYRRLRVVNICLIVALLLTIPYTLYVRMHMHSHGSDIPLGADPFGYVPVGESAVSVSRRNLLN